MSFISKVTAGLVLILFATSVFAQYFAVVDGGSSGSKMHLYSVEDGKITEITPKGIKATTALSRLATDSASVSQFVTTLTNQIANVVDKNHTVTPSEINFYIYATAGMRLAPPSQAEKLYPELTGDLVADGFKTVSVKTITGKMEGVYDWIALNYLKNTLASPSKNTFGVLDMGGASTEIAFATQENISPDNKFIVNINNHTYQLYSHSYLGLGQDVARSQYASNANCFPVGYALPSGSAGNGDYSACAQRIAPLVEQVQHVHLALFPKANRFYAISGFYYTATAKPFNSNDGTMTLSKLANSGKAFCHTNWSTLKNLYPDDKYMYGYCFNTAYYDVLLRQGYRFGVQGGDQLSVAKSIDDTDIDWTLGVALLKSQAK